jgi:hypothetical protein
MQYRRVYSLLLADLKRDLWAVIIELADETSQRELAGTCKWFFHFYWTLKSTLSFKRSATDDTVHQVSLTLAASQEKQFLTPLSRIVTNAARNQNLVDNSRTVSFLEIIPPFASFLLPPFFLPPLQSPQLIARHSSTAIQRAYQNSWHTVLTSRTSL